MLDFLFLLFFLIESNTPWGILNRNPVHFIRKQFLKRLSETKDVPVHWRRWEWVRTLTACFTPSPYTLITQKGLIIRNTSKKKSRGINIVFKPLPQYHLVLNIFYEIHLASHWYNNASSLFPCKHRNLTVISIWTSMRCNEQVPHPRNIPTTLPRVPGVTSRPSGWIAKWRWTNECARVCSRRFENITGTAQS